MRLINEQLRVEVCTHTKSAYAEHLFAGTSGNLSFYDRKEGLVYITPTSYPYEMMEPEDIVVIDMDGNLVDGLHQPSSEYLLHLELYKSREDVCSVVHTHSPFATSFAVTHDVIPMII